jgi:hypothetical protein
MICENAEKCHLTAYECIHSLVHESDIGGCDCGCNVCGGGDVYCIEVGKPTLDDIKTPSIQEAMDYLQISEVSFGEARVEMLKKAYDTVGEELTKVAAALDDKGLKGDQNARESTDEKTDGDTTIGDT